MEQLESDDYFEVLGLARSATDSDVRKAYRRLAVQWHPDKNRSHAKAEEYFKRIAEAYAVLSDPEQREVYERYGKSTLGDSDTPSGASDFGVFHDYDHRFGHGGFAGVSARHARDIFEAFFAGMDPLQALFGDAGRSSSSHRRSRQHRQPSEWDPFGDMGVSFGVGFGGMDMGMGMHSSSMRGGGMSMLDSFFGGGGFTDFSSFGGSGFGGASGGLSSSVSSSTYTDHSGHVVTKKTTTTVDASGHAETVTEEFRNGRLVSSTSSSRLADAGRMQLEGGRSGAGAGASVASAHAPHECEPQLRECLDTVDKLTAANTKLRVRLRRAKQRLEASASDPTPQPRDASAQLRRTSDVQSGDSQEAPSRAMASARPSSEDDTLRSQLEMLNTQLASRERENIALLQSLNEQQEKQLQHASTIAELEWQLAAANESHRKQLHDVETAHVAKLASYMDDVVAKLKRLERDNGTLSSENQVLEASVAALKQAAQQQRTQSSRVVTVSDQWTETESEHEQTVRRDLETRIRVLELQLAQVQCQHEALLASSRQTRELHSLELTEHESYDAKTFEIETLRAQFAREFSDLRAASNAAACESEQRIAFLTACVDECARLVDSPNSEKVTTGDIHDTLVALSRSVVTAAAAAAAGPQTQRTVPKVSDRAGPAQMKNDELQWSIRAVALEQQLRAAQLKTDTAEDMMRRSETQFSDLRDEVKQRVVRELALVAKSSALKEELAALRVHFVTLSSRFDDARDALQMQMHELETARREGNRVRSALQRKSELLSRSKQQVAQLTEELRCATGRIDALAGAEKKSTLHHQRAKEQVQALHDAKRQLEASQAHEYQLTLALEKEQELNRGLQTRAKALRAENAALRAQLSSVKKHAEHRRDGGDGVGGSESSARVGIGRQITKLHDAEVAASPVVQDETRALRKRVLQKQQLLLAHRSKLAEKDREVAQLRSRVLAAAQMNRELQLDLSAQKDSALRHVATMRAETDDIVACRTEQLDGLRASVYDSLEAFVHCGSSARNALRRDDASTRACTNSESAATAAAYIQLDDATVLEMRRWTDLSASELETLYKHSPGEHRHVALQQQTQGRQLLSGLERALEQSPEDCRVAMCRLLEFLCARERERFVASAAAPSY